MNDFTVTVDEFLKFNRYDIFDGFGKVKKSVADEKVINAYKTFNKTKKINSDSEQIIKELK